MTNDAPHAICGKIVYQDGLITVLLIDTAPKHHGPCYRIITAPQAQVTVERLNA